MTYEVGSQVQYQLESATVRNQGRISVRNAEELRATAQAARGEGDATTEWGRVQSALADVFPHELLAYAAKMNDVESWTFGATGIEVAAQMTEQTRRVRRGEDGFLLSYEAPPALPAVPTQTAHQSLDEPNEGGLIVPPPPNPMLERARNGLMLAAPLAPALEVARARSRGCKGHRGGRPRPSARAKLREGDVRNPGIDDAGARGDGGTGFEHRDRIRLAAGLRRPVRGGCEATEHFKRVPKMRKLALGSRTLFDVTVNRLTKSVMEATYPRPSLVAARRKGNNLGSPMANWNRLLHAARQARRRTAPVQLFAWVRAALAGAEGAAHERADIVGRYDSLAALVHACFVFEPEKHRATAPAAAADFPRSRRAVSAGAGGNRRRHQAQSARARGLHGRHRPRRGRPVRVRAFDPPRAPHGRRGTRCLSRPSTSPRTSSRRG